jgi:hypothetical protein
MRGRRIASQRQYFTEQARRRRQAERRTKLIPPACFFLSIFCAVVHFGGEFFEHRDERLAASHPGKKADAPQSPPADEQASAPHAGTSLLARILTACMIGAAAFPVFGAMFRTIRTAFEFGRNANRFEGVARILANVDKQLNAAASQPADKPPPRAVQLELLREAEFVLQHENRSWMRLMIEAEWFG